MFALGNIANNGSFKKFNIRGYSTNDKVLKLKLPDNSFFTHNIEKGPKLDVTTNRDELLGFYKEMDLIRKIEVAADKLYKSQHIAGFLHLYNGQESVCSGFESVLTPEDSVITAYRCHGFLLCRRCGMDPKEVLSELTGRATGCSRGKGGSMHMYDANNHFYGGNGIVGAQISLGTGIAFANKYLKNGRVCFSYMGDGAFNQGQVSESFNMAALWKLPVVYVVENNKYGMGTSIDRASADVNFYKRGVFVPGIKVNGFNVLAVKEAGRFAAQYVLENGPIIIEAETYRYFGHSVSDPGNYRKRSEVQDIRKNDDCIGLVSNMLLSNSLATETELELIDEENRKIVDEAVEFSINAPAPEPKELYTNVLKTDIPVRGVEMSL